MQTITNYIGGDHAQPASGEYLDVIEPATGRAYARVPDSDASDIDRAVTAAGEAFPAWAATPADERCRLLMKLANLIEHDLDALAHAETVDTGKPISLARTMDIPRAAKNIRFFATAILHEASQCHVTDRQALNYTLRRPRGVCGIISPWNLPLYLLTWKLAPAVAVGNTIVAKPAELTPMTAFLLGRLCEKAGIPPGVINIVHGAGAGTGQALVEHESVGTISFTGGSATGRTVAATAAPRLKRVALELGGKNPNIIFADTDLHEAVEASVRAAFANQGQICLCGSRILVEHPIYESFLQQFLQKTASLKVADPFEPDTNLGALISKPHLDKVQSYIELARQEGGRIECGGRKPDNLADRCENGFFLEPTVFTGLDATCRVNREEIFGPVVTIMPFQDEAQALELANGTPYGLSATVWTRDLARAHRLAERIDAGTVWVNCWLVRDLRVPFGGVKQSGLGREGGREAIRFFTEPKNVCIKLEDTP